MDLLIEGTGGPFDGYRVSWPGRRLPEGVTYSALKKFSASASSASSVSSLSVWPDPNRAVDKADNVDDEETPVAISMDVVDDGHPAVATQGGLANEGQTGIAGKMEVELTAAPEVDSAVKSEHQTGFDALSFAVSVAMEDEQSTPAVAVPASSTVRTDFKKQSSSIFTPALPPIDWRNVYYLERDANADDKDSDEDEENADGDQSGDPASTDVDAPAKSFPRYLTALREHDGSFVPIPKQYLKLVFPYAKRGVLPISNLVQLAYICPKTSECMLINRQYCDQALYKEMVIKTIKENGNLYSLYFKESTAI
jgi:hypothetical protein